MGPVCVLYLTGDASRENYMIVYRHLLMKVSTTTSNFMIGVTAAASVGIYFSRGDIPPLIASPVALGILIGALVGTRLLVIKCCDSFPGRDCSRRDRDGATRIGHCIERCITDMGLFHCQGCSWGIA